MPNDRAEAPSRATRRSNHLLLLIAASMLLTVAAGTIVSHAQQTAFASPAFQVTWDRTDRLVASGAVSRSWTWGPAPGRSTTEPYAGIPGNNHLVQYFDKGRMEINNPAGDPKDPFFVTNGLLALDLISGQMQTGVASYEARPPAAINLGADADDPTAPTYQSFNGVSNVPGAKNERRKESQTGQLVRTAIDRQGVTQPWPADHADYGVRIAYFEPATGHNIPDVFWEFLNSKGDILQDGKQVNGPLYYPWFSATGYPISEPYWSYVKVSGKYTDVLSQAFERRVLTFVPHLPTPFKVQMGNIGLHYYEWRYTAQPPRTPQPPRATPTVQALPVKANVTIDSINYRQTIVDLNGNFITITNRGATAVRFDGWWIDSPKWGYVDRYYFPNGVTLAPNASFRVHAGLGSDTATDLYMRRTSIMWDGKPYDFALIYDNYGREVDRFFPAAEQGPPPTQPAVQPTPNKDSTATPIRTALATATRGTPQPTSTRGVPSPVGTGVSSLPTLTPSRTPATVTPTPTP